MNASTGTVDPWAEIARLTGQAVPEWVKDAFAGPKLVTVPAGRTLYAAGAPDKDSLRWGAFEELDLDWYGRGNQLDPDWYAAHANGPIPIYEYSVRLTQPTPAIMGKVADQRGAQSRIGPAKFQYYNPAGFGLPRRGQLLGYWNPSA